VNSPRSKTIATICARGGSQGLPRKNVRPFAGKPLIAHTIEQALACPLIDAVYVSTDDDEIAAVAREYGAQVPYRRPAELATHRAAKIPAIEHLVAHLEAQGERIGLIVDLQPTSPLRTQQDLAEAIALAPQADLIVTVTQPSHNPYYTLVETQADGTLRLSKPATFVSRQEIPQAWGLNGSIYVWQRAALARAATEGFWSVSVRGSVMPRHRSVDIDDALDFDMAEWLWRRQETAGEA
jgi:CMP-N,N'-diacetyllegionaminic acid synthase